ncbi:hypothetical protein GCM10009613_61140 [Pseudonocardia kongjuensis]|uniref:MuF-like minor capsid protein n=1 Tax=Pseudonocardia kongjuensis TaxID=102227 RepID=A0ABN1YAV4_9PSEU
MTAPAPGAAQLAASYAAARAALAASTVAAARPRWAALDVYDSAAVDEFARLVAQLSQAAQLRSAGLTEAYLRGTLSLMGAAPADRTPARPTGRRRTDPLKVYGRPAETVRYERSTGVALLDARASGGRRLDTMLDTDVALAARDAAHSVLSRTERIIGWRRVLRPEMSRRGPCGLCIVASDRLYHRGDLLDLHDGCYCLPMPVTRSHDPGQQLNAEDLQAVYDAADGRTDRQALQRVRIATREHDELGPRLVDARHRFRGPDDVAA